MAESYRVRVSKEYLVFSAAHFITFNGDVCERIHGHNYGVEAEVRGPLDENHYVVDFILLRDTLRALVDQWDHRVLLPTQHKQIHVQVEEHEVEATFQDRRWIFPRGDCALLPVANTTAELLARHLGQQVLEKLETAASLRPDYLRLAVDENHGQWGEWVWQA